MKRGRKKKSNYVLDERSAKRNPHVPLKKRKQMFIRRKHVYMLSDEAQDG